MCHIFNDIVKQETDVIHRLAHYFTFQSAAFVLTNIWRYI